MGKGEIIQKGEKGLYKVKLLYDRVKITSEIAALAAKVESITIKIAGMEDGREKDLMVLQKTSIEKRKRYLETVAPEENPIVSAWCADMTKDLGGIVGTIEVPGEAKHVNIRPGYNEGANYDVQRDGQLQSAGAGSAAGAFYNLAMLPGWQKWKPTYRYGVIKSINHDQDVCNVELDNALSTVKNLPVNQDFQLSIPIEYMQCNSSCFKIGDRVIVEFAGQKWDSGKVIGFQSDPRSCYWESFDGFNLCDEHIWNINIVGYEFQCVLPYGYNSEMSYSYDLKKDVFSLDVTFDLSGYFLTYPYWDATISGIGDESISAKFCKFKINTVVTGSGSGSDRSFIALKLKFDDDSISVFLLAGDATVHYSGTEYDYTGHGGESTEIDLAALGITTQKIIAVSMDTYCVGQGTLNWEWEYIDFYQEKE